MFTRAAAYNLVKMRNLETATASGELLTYLGKPESERFRPSSKPGPPALFTCVEIDEPRLSAIRSITALQHPVNLPAPDNRLVTRPTPAKRDKPVPTRPGPIISSIAIEIQHPKPVHVYAYLTRAAPAPIRNNWDLTNIPAIPVKFVATRANSVVSAVSVIVQNLEPAAIDTDLSLPVSAPVPKNRNITRCIGKSLIVLVRRRIDPVAVIIQHPLTLVEVTHLGPLGATPIPYTGTSPRPLPPKP